MNKLFFIFLILFCRLSFAQEWNFVNKDYNSSLVSIQSTTSFFIEDKKAESSLFCSGVIIKQDKDNKCPDPNFSNYIYTQVLTCAHINNTDAKLLVKTMNNVTSNASIIKIGNEVDLDLMLLSCYIPEMISIEIGELPLTGEEVTIVGLGGQSVNIVKEKIRVFNVKKVGPKETLILDGFVIPGDSGGPIIYKEKVVGIVSGGYNWYQDKQKYTWPIISASTTKIKEFLK